jgi:hypothetical protein
MVEKPIGNTQNFTNKITKPNPNKESEKPSKSYLLFLKDQKDEGLDYPRIETIIDVAFERSHTQYCIIDFDEFLDRVSLVFLYDKLNKIFDESYKSGIINDVELESISDCKEYIDSIIVKIYKLKKKEDLFKED